MKRLMSFLKDEEGAVAIEYVLLAGLIAIVIIVGATYLGVELNTFLSDVGDEVSDVAPA